MLQAIEIQKIIEANLNCKFIKDSFERDSFRSRG